MCCESNNANLSLRLLIAYFASHTKQCSSVEALRPSQHVIGHFRDNFYRPQLDHTDSITTQLDLQHGGVYLLTMNRDVTACYLWACLDLELLCIVAI